jgi:hypothetical protein
MLRHLSFVRTDVSEETIISIIRIVIIGELETMLVLISSEVRYPDDEGKCEHVI